jgi:hypothetical protein
MLIGGAPALLVSCEVIAIADGEASLASEWSLFRASRREMKADGRWVSGDTLHARDDDGRGGVASGWKGGYATTHMSRLIVSCILGIGRVKSYSRDFLYPGSPG